MNYENNYIDYLKKLKKNELTDIIKDYNLFSEIFKIEKIDLKNTKKNQIIDEIIKIKEDYLKYIILSLDLEDFNKLKEIIHKKVDNEYLISNREFINYLIEKKIIFKDNELLMAQDIKETIIKLIKNKEVIKYINTWDRIYKLVDGIIIAYGVVSIKYFNIVISGIPEKLIIPKLNYYYKKEYKIDSKKIMSNKLTNKKRIDKYLKDNNYKYFTNKDYVLLGSIFYHHNIKSYKKFIKMLKSNYIFKNKDIEFVDKYIVIPYLYNSINEEEIAKDNLEETVIKYFEFKKDKLKNKMLEEIIKIRDEFPLWEYRGYTKKEVENEK